MGQLVGAGIELRIAQGLRAKHQRRGIGGALNLGFNQHMQAGVGRVLSVGAVPVVHSGLYFTGVEHRQLTDPLFGVVHQRLQQVAPVPCHTADGGAVKQVIGIGQCRVQTARFLVGVQAQVKLRGAPFPLNQAQCEPRSRFDRFNVGHLRLMVVHHLKQRVVAQVALKLEGFYQLLERQFLMGLSTERSLFDRSQQLGHGSVRRQLGAQYLGVHKEADQPFDFTAVAVGNRHAHAQIVLPAVALQQDVERAQQQHEQRDRVLLRQGPQLLNQLRSHRELMARAAIAGHGRARVVVGQGDDRVLITQLGLPVRQLPRLLTGLQPAALPQGVVAVLDGQFRQLRRLVTRKGIVTADKFVDQHVHRPAIGDDVVQGQQQHMLVSAKLEQLDPQQRAIGQIERLQRLLLRLSGHRLFALDGRQQAEI